MALIERPYELAFSKNEIRYVFQLDNLSRPGLLLQVKLLYTRFGAAKELYFFTLKPDTSGKVYVYVQGYLDSLLTPVMPLINSVFTNADGQACKYHIHYREIDNDNQDTQWNTSESDHQRIALKGGIEKHKTSRNNFFINYFNTAKPWLTWQPSGRFIFEDEPAYLTMLNPAIVTTGYKLIVKGEDVFGIKFQKSIPVPISGMLMHIAVSAKALNLGIESLCFYCVHVEDNDKNVIVNPHQFYIEKRPLYSWFDLIYQNSIGGIDFVRGKGEISVSIDRNTTAGESGLSLSDWYDQVKSHEKNYVSISQKRVYKADIGFLRTMDQQESLIEILVSKAVYQIIDSRWVPVLNIQKTADLGSILDNKKNFPVEWTLSEENEVFTPIRALFGNGTLEEIAPPPDQEPDPEPACIPVSFAGFPSLPKAFVNTPYNYSINLNGTAPISISSPNKPAWLNISVNDKKINFSGTPSDIANNIPVSFVLTNCSTIPLDFSDTISVINRYPGFKNTVTVFENESQRSMGINIESSPNDILTFKITSISIPHGGMVKWNGVLCQEGEEFIIKSDATGKIVVAMDLSAGVDHGAIVSVDIAIIRSSAGSAFANNIFSTYKINES